MPEKLKAEVVNPLDKPVPVQVVKPPGPPSAVPEDPPAKATTTSEENLTTAGQRRINVIWEVTQAIIAVGVSLGTIFVLIVVILRDGSQAATTAFLLLSNAFFMIVTAYFQRTNHTRVGGIGKKPGDER